MMEYVPRFWMGHTPFSFSIVRANDLSDFQEEVNTFFDSPDFDTMLNKVGAHDVLSFKNNNDGLTTHPAKF